MFGHPLLGEENGLSLLVHRVETQPGLPGNWGASPPTWQDTGQLGHGPLGLCTVGLGCSARGAKEAPSWVPEDSAPPTLQVCSSSQCRNGAHGAAELVVLQSALPGGRR